MSISLSDAETVLLCDESKFYINNGDFEDSIYYFCVTVPTNKVGFIHREFEGLLKSYRIKSSPFHSTDIFRETRPRERLIAALTELITSNQLHCFCFKYWKELLYEPTKYLKYLNDNDIIDFTNSEFQALFYFLVVFNTHLRDELSDVFGEKMIMYFDRNVYGKEDTEAFTFPSDHFVIKRMTFSEKSLISLLALPDFFGYIFRKSKTSHNKVQSGDNSLETSRLIIKCHDCLLKILGARLFHFLDVNQETLEKALRTSFLD